MNKRKSQNILPLFILAYCVAGSVHAASGVGTAAGLTLLRAPGARSAALGGAFTAVTDDVTAMSYNPASLQSLNRGQASFLYDRGMVDDAYGQFLIGTPSKIGSFGLSVGYYDSGSFELTDQNMTTRSVRAQTDLSAAIGYGNAIGPVRFGINAKYLSSKLIERYSAKAYAADIGAQMNVGKRIGFGVAAQNLGSQLTYVTKGYNLPRVYRAGTSILLFKGTFAATFLGDLPYYAEDKKMRPAAGLEFRVGPLAFRGGYHSTDGLEKDFTFGAGFNLGPSAIDYSFGMADELDSEHRVSFSLNFGGPPETVHYNFPSYRRSNKK